METSPRLVPPLLHCLTWLFLNSSWRWGASWLVLSWVTLLLTGVGINQFRVGWGRWRESGAVSMGYLYLCACMYVCMVPWAHLYFGALQCPPEHQLEVRGLAGLSTVPSAWDRNQLRAEGRAMSEVSLKIIQSLYLYPTSPNYIICVFNEVALALKKKNYLHFLNVSLCLQPCLHWPMLHLGMPCEACPSVSLLLCTHQIYNVATIEWPWACAQHRNAHEYTLRAAFSQPQNGSKWKVHSSHPASLVWPGGSVNIHLTIKLQYVKILLLMLCRFSL